MCVRELSRVCQVRVCLCVCVCVSLLEGNVREKDTCGGEVCECGGEVWECGGKVWECEAYSVW